jgi:hypothetical protein
MFTLLVLMTVLQTGARYPTVHFDMTFQECTRLGDIVKNSYADNPTVKVEYVCVPQK